RSIALYEGGLHRLGHRVPRGRAAFLLGTFRQAIIQAGHTYLPGRLHRRSPVPREELAIQLFGRIGLSYYFQDSLKSTWAVFLALNRAEQLPPSPELAFAYAECGLLWNVLGLHSRAARYFDRSIDLSRRFEDGWGIGLSLCRHGIG